MESVRGESTWVETFVGGGNMISEVTGDRIGYDYNKGLISCLEALANGWEPPLDITRDFYSECRTASRNGEISPIIGYVGINGSYGGRWFDGGYAGETTTKEGKIRNYPQEAHRHVMANKDKIKGVSFLSTDYKDVETINLPDNSLIYADPPYKGTKTYQAAKESGFCSEEHWQWCRDMSDKGHKVFVSEYQAPDDFICIWEKGVTSSMRANSEVSGAKLSTERLFVHIDFYNKHREVFK